MLPARSHTRNTLTLHSVLFPWDTLFQHQFSTQGSATEFRVLEVTDFPPLLLGLEDFVSPVERGDGQVKPPKDKNHRHPPPPGPCWPLQLHKMAGPLVLSVAHAPSIPTVWEGCLYFEDCGGYGSISGTDFLARQGLCSLAKQGLILSLAGPGGLTGSCPHHPPCLPFFQREGASSLPSTYFQLSYILHKVNLANREHSENIFGFEASVF